MLDKANKSVKKQEKGIHGNVKGDSNNGRKAALDQVRLV
jgi:hypothetical protein